MFFENWLLGQEALLGELHGLVDEPEARDLVLYGDAAALGHLAGVAQQAEAGHVRAGVDAVFDHRVARVFVQGGHELHGIAHRLLRAELRLGSGGENAYAERLGEDEHVAGPRAGVGEYALRVDEARDCEAVLRLVVEDAVAAGDDGPGLVDLVVAAAEQGVDGLTRHLLRHAHEVERQLGLAAHGIDVRERVRCGDLAEGVGVVRDRREEVDGLHQRKLVRDLVHRGVVALVEADEQVRVVADLYPLQQLGEDARADLCAAAGAFGELRELELIFHLPLPFPRFQWPP